MQDAKRRALIFLIIALLLAGIAGFLFLQKVGAVDARLGDRTTIFVANKDIPAREPLTPDDFKAVPVPTQFVQDSSVTGLEKIKLGEYQFPIQQLVSVTPLSKGDPLMDYVLKPQSALTAGDKRMVTLAQSNRIRFDGSINVNDRVDIVVSNESKGSRQTSVFMKDVPVVAIAEDGDGNVSGLGLEMTLEEAEKMIHQENFAISIRVLKAPNAKGNSNSQVGNRQAQKINIPKQKNQEASENTEGPLPGEGDPQTNE